MAFDILIQAAGDYFTIDHIAAHIGDFFRSFVNQQHDQSHIGMIGGDTLADMLQHDRFARPRRSHDQRALSFAERGKQINNTVRNRLLTYFQFQPLLGVDSGQSVEVFDLAVFLWGQAIDIDDFADARPLLSAGMLHHATDFDALSQSKLFDHRAGNKWIGTFA